MWWMVACALWGADAPQVDVTTLNGGKTSGELVAFSPQGLTVRGDSGETKLLTEDLLELRTRNGVRGAGGGLPPAGTATLQLLDGSQLGVTDVRSAADLVTSQHAELGKLSTKLATVRGLRFALPDLKLDPAWKQLFDRPSKKDMLVIKKGDVLDHLDGVIGAIDDQTVKFLLDGDEISVKREKIYGLIWNRKGATPSRSAVVADLATGDRLFLKHVAWNGSAWQFTMNDNNEPVSVPNNVVANLDFSIAKITYLSVIEPRDVRYKSFFPEDETTWGWVFAIRRDRGFEGQPLQVGNKVYPRGLAVHSRTQLKYRLGTEYRRFQTVMAIDHQILSGNGGICDVTISGDGKVLYQGELKPQQPPISLDLDVANVVEFEILVDFGGDKFDQGDRVHFADAKFVR